MTPYQLGLAVGCAVLGFGLARVASHLVGGG